MQEYKISLYVDQCFKLEGTTIHIFKSLEKCAVLYGQIVVYKRREIDLLKQLDDLSGQIDGYK